ncbi:origin recognition complex subunit 3 [Salarias fasciatus]|uniref:origin recognition complex subunit 3 n=1 Tax=Salarias fasciatus TaxID=181472 RepID=UPI0011766475|nr:origin recognition complex subunit 3 [Salarias fasciatus]
MSTSSVSKGCFVFKPAQQQQQPKKRKKTETETESPSLESWFCEGCESADSSGSRSRFRLCQELWDHIRSETQVLQDELNRKVLDSLLDFVRTRRPGGRHGDWASQMRASEIPTAALVLGVNVPDHDVTFQSLSELLLDSVTPHVASVEAKEAPVLKQLMKRVLERLMKTAVEDVEDGEDGEDGGDGGEEEQSGTPSHRTVHCSLGQLSDWYSSRTKRSSSSSPGKKRSSVDRDVPPRPPLVIIFKDLEAFSPRVLQDFILVCSRYVERLPLVFIFGIATSPSTLQHMLPHSVSSLLCVQLFQSLCCTQHLSTVMDQLVLTARFPFKLTGKVLQVLLSVFLYHDFSVSSFIKGLQVSLLEHFSSQPLSLLCCRKSEALLQLSQLGPRDLDRIRALASFQRYLEQQDSQDQDRLRTDDAFLKEVCHRLIKDLHKYHKSYYPTLRCLHTLTSALPRYPLGKQIRELHLICLEQNVWENQDYQAALKLLRMLAKDELLTLLHRCLDTLQAAKSKRTRRAALQLEELLCRFKQLDDVTETQDYFSSPIKDLQKKTDLFQLQKTLLQLNETRRSRKLSPFERLRAEAVELLDSLVRTHLAPPESQPLHEVCYYSSSSTVRRHLNAAPRTSIQAALSCPYFYLQNENLRTEDGSVSNAAPDLCITYKLHLECGRLINLYDWMEAFSTVVSAAEQLDPESGGSGGSGGADEVQHARFIRSVSELEFLGFIKSTKKKTDHVSRLTWGGC